MAVIGHAEIVVRAITNNFEKELKDTLKNVSKSISVGAGRRIGDGFADGFNRSGATSVFGKVSDGLRSMVPEAESARERFQSLVRTGFVLQGVLGSIAGAISSVVVSIGPLIGSLGRAAGAVGVLAAGFVTLRVAMTVGRIAFGNIFGAVQQATQAGGGYAKSLKDIREEWQQLKFEAEGAALSQEEAALNLEKARNNLLRMQDLPPNSMARREAELEVKQAELAYRRAVDRTKDLNKTVEEGFDAFKDAQRTAGGAAADPLSQLNAAQRKFAERLIKLNPKLDALKLKMSDAFLEPLYESVDVFETRLLPIFDKRLPAIARQAGDAINQAFTGLDFDGIDDILAEMTTPFEDGGRSNLQLFGDILEDILNLFVKIVDAAGKPLNDLLTDISDGIQKMTDGLDETEMEAFFTSAVEEAQKWWKVLQNVFGGFQNLITLTTGPGSAGEYMLQWFTEASEAFKNMFAEDPDAGKQFFKDAMVNARSVFSSIGAFIKEILGVADNPAIKETFDTLKEGAPNFGKFLNEIVEAGPSFADLLVNIGRIITALTDSEQVSAFFDTLSIGADKLADVLETDGVKKLLDNLGPIFGALSAIGVIINVIQFGFQVLIGYLAFVFLKGDEFIKKMIGGPGAIGRAFGALGGLLKGAGVLGVILFIIGKIQEFYNEFEDFREMVDSVLAGVGEAFGGLWESISGLFENLFGGEGLGGLMEALDPILKFLLELLIPAVGGAIEGMLNSLSSIIDFISNTVGILFDSVGLVVEGILDLFKGDFKSGFIKIFGGIGIALLGIVQFIVNGVITLINVAIIDRINSFISSIAEGPIGKFIKDTFGLDATKVKVGKLGLVDWTGDARRNLDSYIASQNQASAVTTRTRANGLPKLAMGGVVYPSVGGSIVNVAEAGRPERIEPLDPNGLSKRDLAMIKELSGGPGINVTVNPSAGMDERELAEIVSRRIAFEIRKGSF